MMQALANQSLYQSDQIFYLSVADIVPNPAQPRRFFGVPDLRELADSILRYGVLQPLTVRRDGNGFELVAGERRLRASRLAGLTRVPCIILDVNIEDSSILALVENLQRKNLHYIEEAEALTQLIQTLNLTQEEAARRIGKNQSTVANKLRLLSLPQEMRARLKETRLTERHARALLRLHTNADRFLAIEYIVEHKLTVLQTEEYVDSTLAKGEAEQVSATPKPAGKRPMYVIRDIRFFLNTVNRAMEIMTKSGIGAKLERVETEDGLELTIKIPRTEKGMR